MNGFDFVIDGAAFADSLQYMLKGMLGIFLVTAVIIAAMAALSGLTKKRGE